MIPNELAVLLSVAENLRSSVRLSQDFNRCPKMCCCCHKCRECTGMHGNAHCVDPSQIPNSFLHMPVLLVKLQHFLASSVEIYSICWSLPQSFLVLLAPLQVIKVMHT